MQVFISYAEEDFKVAKRLYDDLGKIDKIKPWMKGEDLVAGLKQNDAILMAIKKSSCCLFLLSRKSVGRKSAIGREHKIALNILDEVPPGQIFIIPVRLEDCEIKEEKLEELHKVDLFPDYDKGYRKILKSLQKRGEAMESSLDKFEEYEKPRSEYPAKEKDAFEKLIYEILSTNVVHILVQLWSMIPKEMDIAIPMDSVLRLRLDSRVAMLVSATLTTHFIIPLGDYLAKYFSSFIPRSETDEIGDIIGPLFSEIRLREVRETIEEQNTKLLKKQLRDNIPSSSFKSCDPSILSQLDDTLFHLCELAIDLYRVFPDFRKSGFERLTFEKSELADTFKAQLNLFGEKQDRIWDNTISRFENTYLSEIVRIYDKVKILGINLPYESRVHQLSMAYVPLLMQQIEPENTNRSNLHIEDILDVHSRVIIQAEAGFGKTTILHWIAVLCGTESHLNTLPFLKDKIPLLLKLREFSEKEFPPIGDFPSLTTKGKIDIGRGDHARWVKADILEKGRAIVMLDGMDEIRQNKRDEIIGRIEYLCEEFPDNIYILTSRPAGITDQYLDRLKKNHFTFFEVKLMNFDLICMLIRNWHMAVAKKTHSDTNCLNKDASNLIEQIAQRISLRTLADSPLLCSVLCALNYNSEYDLPERRIEIYDECCKLLLHERDLAKGIDDKIKKVHFTYDEKIVFIKHVAEQMTAIEEELEIGEDMFLEYLQNKINHLPKAKDYDITADELKRYFLERSGLIRLNAKDKVEFVHTIFQEYLAAKSLVDKKIKVQYLIDRARHPFWNIVIELSAGMLNDVDGEKLVEGILKESEKHQLEESLIILAVRCFWFLSQAKPELQDEIKKKRSFIIPPKDSAGISGIAASEDLALPLLKKKKGRNVSEDLNCIRTLVKINTYASYFLLVSYFVDDRPEYRKSITMALNDIDGGIVLESGLLQIYEEHCKENGPIEDYAKRILCLLQEAMVKYQITAKPNIKDLDLSQKWIKNVSFLSGLKELRLLNLSGTLIEDLAPLSTLPQLRTLDISSTPVGDVSCISGLQSLEILRMNNTPVEDFSPIVALRSLKALQINQDVDPSILGQLKDIGVQITQIRHATIA